MKKVSIHLFVLISVSLSTYANAAEFASLAIDEKNGSAYGWSYDQKSLTAAEQRALQECNKRSGNNQCSVVLAWSGEGCGAYRTVDGRVGTAYGWAVASTQNSANALANREALKRSNGIVAPNYVWACNTRDKSQLKVIKKEKSDVKTVNIGSQVWMAENLKVTHFNNGDLIPFAKNTAEAQVYYKNKQRPARIWKDNLIYENKYGRFYSWQIANDKRGICPAGFHLPSKNEWNLLFKAVSDDPKVIAKKLKSKKEWIEDAGMGTDDYGFSVLPAGYVVKSDSFNLEFDDRNQSASFWTSTSYDSDSVWAVEFAWYNQKAQFEKVGREAALLGMSIRCIQD